MGYQLVQLATDTDYTNTMIALNKGANGDSDMVDVSGYNVLCFQITGIIGGATVTFKGACGGSDFVDILATNITSNASAVSATVNGVYRVNVAGLRYVKAVYSGITQVESTETTNYAVVDATGVVTFETGFIPLAGQMVTADYDYTIETTDEQLGIGDGVNAEFTFSLGEIVALSEVIKVDGVTKTRTVDYNIVDATGVVTFIAGKIPANAAVVTGSALNIASVTAEILGFGDGINDTFGVDNIPILSQTIYVGSTSSSIKTVMTI